MYSLSRERRQTAELAASNQSLTATMSKMESQLDALRIQFAELQATRTAPAPQEPTRKAARPAPRHSAQPPRDDPRFDQLRAQLSSQQHEIAGAKDQIQQTRSDLQGRLDSTRDELNGSIARTHDDVVALQKRGERNYYEFGIDKSKQFQKVGPIRVSVRKVDEKHKRYDMVLMVDDFEIQKKSVNLFEPVWITVVDGHPLELVVNHVRKDQVAGYLSEPKYKNSELTAAASGTAATDTRENLRK